MVFNRLHFSQQKKHDRKHYQKLSMRLGQTTHVTTYAFHMFAMVLKWLSMVFPMVFQESAMVFSWFPMIFKMVAMAFNRLPFSQQKNTTGNIIKSCQCAEAKRQMLWLMLSTCLQWFWNDSQWCFQWFSRTCNGLLLISNNFPNGCNGFQSVAFWSTKNMTGHIIKSCQCAEAKRQMLCFTHVCFGSKMTPNGVSNGFPRTCNGLLMISNDFPNGCNGFQLVAF